MIEISPPDRRVLAHWFSTVSPGPAAIAAHVLATGIGRWWGDRRIQPSTVAVSCAGHVVLRGSPEELTPNLLAPLAGNRVEAPARFLPALGAAFDRLTPWERMIGTLQTTPQPATVPHAVTVRHLKPADAEAVHGLGPDASWLSASWGGPRGLAASGHAWAAVGRIGRILAVACTYFRGSRHEDVAVHTVPDRRRHHLALACVTSLCGDITARGHIPSWNCSLHNRASRLLAWNAGFRLVREYVHYAAGSPVSRARLSASDHSPEEATSATSTLAAATPTAPPDGTHTDRRLTQPSPHPDASSLEVGINRGGARPAPGHPVGRDMRGAAAASSACGPGLACGTHLGVGASSTRALWQPSFSTTASPPTCSCGTSTATAWNSTPAPSRPTPCPGTSSAPASPARRSPVAARRSPVAAMISRPASW
ncbi:GNAT family N-acetyltransferase [Streptomyces sp. NPDC093261]|uniref:GNAT family N-acetyltransferase n=1 Tax=Streptomyces sp. NPDC093261 TaxID=3366037 RepID=UPI003806B2E9